MKCTINVLIGEESIPILVDVDSSLIPSDINEDFMNIVKLSGKIDLIQEKLKSLLLEGRSEQFIGEDKEKFGQIQIANNTAKDIALSSPPDIQSLFPSMDLTKIKVRLVDKFNNYGTNIILKKAANGEIIYLLDRNPRTFKKFAQHLAIENAINNDVLNKLAEDSEEIKTIDIILGKAKSQYKEVNDRKSLLKHYIKNKSKYSKIIIPTLNGNYTASALLDNIIPEISGIYFPKNNNYSTPLVKSLFAPGGMLFKNRLPFIKYSDLYNILSGFVSMSKFKNQKDFNTSMSSNEKSDDIIEFFKLFNIDVSNNPEDNYSILFSLIFKNERGFPYRFKRVTKDGNILFNSTYYDKENTYGLTYDTILLMDYDIYKNWRIYKGENEEYFISQYEMIPSTKGLSYISIKDAKKAIDNKISELTFRNSFLLNLSLDLRKINGMGVISVSKDVNHIQKGTVIKIPNVELPNKIEILDSRENIISGNYNINEFIDTIRLWPEDTLNILLNSKGELITQLNNITNAGVFLILLNTKYLNLTRTPEIVLDILNQMKDAGYKYFYIENTYLIKDKTGNIISKRIKLIKLPENPNYNTDEYKQQKGFLYPIISFWEDVAEILNKTFGTKINIKTLSEILDEFGENYSKAKAFIKGDQVYINSTIGSTEDLLHEYIHIIMGYLKVNNTEAYHSLIKEVWKNTSSKKLNIINSSYSQYDYISKLEENFVARYAEYIYNKGQEEFDNLFSRGIIEEAFETIFDKAEFNFKESGQHKISEIFGRFSSEISMALQKNNKLFDGFASEDAFRLSNQKTNLLHKWILEGKLKEYDCR